MKISNSVIFSVELLFTCKNKPIQKPLLKLPSFLSSRRTVPVSYRPWKNPNNLQTTDRGRL